MQKIDELVDLWEDLKQQGNLLSPEELCADYPELLNDVRWQLQALQAIDSNFGVTRHMPSAHPPQSQTTFQPSPELAVFGRYRLERLHASGGLGQIYLAQDETLNRKVAIKFPKRQGMSAEQIARFEQEARITGQLEHPGIVPIHSLDLSCTAEPCYVMRFVDGATLHQTVEKQLNSWGGNLDRDYFQSDDVRHLLQAFAALCNIVAYAHGRQILHRDIKPSNVLLGPFGETLLLDWGIAKRLQPQSETRSPAPGEAEHRDYPMDWSPDHTAPGLTLGTPAYASPEQSLGLALPIGFASDIYSLGATLFYLLSGKSPLEAAGWRTYFEMLNNVDAKLVSYLPSATPNGLRAICNKCLQVDPARRYSSVIELAADVDRYLAREPLSVLPERWWAKLGRIARKRPTATGALGASALVVMFALIATSTIVNQKNLELSAGIHNLQQALTGVERANEIALNALRGMVDEVVTLKFAQNERLSERERSYIQSILRQYSLLSELQNSSERARTVQAEAFLQIGLLYYQLGQFDDALPSLQTAIELLKQLSAHSRSSKHLSDLSTAYVNVATIEIEQGAPDACLSTTAQAMQFINGIEAELEPQLAYLLAGDTASLHRMRAEALETKDQSRQAILELQLAIDILERMLVESPADVSVQFAIGQVCRMMCCVQSTIAGQSFGTLQQSAQRHGDHAVDVLKRLAEQQADVPRYQMALAWAHFDRAGMYVAIGDFDSAIVDYGAAFDQAHRLSTRFPLIATYRDCQPQMLVRRGRAYSKRGNLPAAASDLSAAAADLATLLVQSPDNQSLHLQLVQTHIELIQLQLRLKQPTNAARTFADARAGLEKLASLNANRAKELWPVLEQMAEAMGNVTD
jgi:serine/threonine protein kinase